MSNIDESLSKFSRFTQKSPVDVILEMLQEKNVLYHTEIPNVSVLNAVDLLIMKSKRDNWDETEQVWSTVRSSIINNMVSHKRKRASEIKEMVKSVMAEFGLESLNDKKGGLFNRK